MNKSFSHLELLDTPADDFISEKASASQSPPYEDAPLDEIFELLESAVETYTALSPSLSPRFRESAEQEIDLFYSLIQQHLHRLLDQTKFTSPQHQVNAA
ncbi:MAG: hypothetical protein MUF49_31440 [Oculatellaceae cyanobacterium Prado106]|jgi:hypothetical protein|nr:hypothetical protein [Oculatellaceae cyanobacterium Prado106]